MRRKPDLFVYLFEPCTSCLKHCSLESNRSRIRDPTKKKFQYCKKNLLLHSQKYDPGQSWGSKPDPQHWSREICSRTTYFSFAILSMIMGMQRSLTNSQPNRRLSTLAFVCRWRTVAAFTLKRRRKIAIIKKVLFWIREKGCYQQWFFFSDICKY